MILNISRNVFSYCLKLRFKIPEIDIYICTSYIYIYISIQFALPVTTIMALQQLVNLGTRCIYIYIYNLYRKRMVLSYLIFYRPYARPDWSEPCFSLLAECSVASIIIIKQIKNAACVFYSFFREMPVVLYTACGFVFEQFVK